LTTGDKFPDALAGGPYLAQDHGTLLLSPLQGPLPDPIATVLAANASSVRHFTFIACIEPVIGQVKALLP
ncbi:MAG: cell wall-binding repeat-containing protein, partial [Thermoleophilia bacterium]|nr:cell wall-binding repeat-containing protein [Thermoleophilia bacterium]